ncbi:MAG: Internalin-A [Chlamydiae bacterium]|nr:Internalin-A [Chlamydiota bacterium]
MSTQSTSSFTISNSISYHDLAKTEGIRCLPDELLLKIFHLLTPEEKVPVSLVCRDWQRICNDSSFWKAFAWRIGIYIRTSTFAWVPRSSKPPPIEEQVRSQIARLIEYTEILPDKAKISGKIKNTKQIYELEKIVEHRDAYVVCSELAKAVRSEIKGDDGKSLEGLENLFQRSKTWLQEKISLLQLFSNNLSQIPSFIGELTGLDHFDLRNNNIREFPTCISQLISLTWLFLDNNKLEKIPDSISSLISLTRLELNNNHLKEISDSIGNLTSLTELKLNNNRLKEIPGSIGKLVSLRKLNLSDNALEEVPNTIGHLTSLEILNLSHNNFKVIQTSIGLLTSLKELHLDYNPLSKLPSSISLLTSLEILDLSYSNVFMNSPPPIEHFASIGHLTSLKELYLDDRDVKHLPEALKNNRNLKILKF